MNLEPIDLDGDGKISPVERLFWLLLLLLMGCLGIKL